MIKYNRKTNEILEYLDNESWYNRVGDGCTDGFNSREELNNWIDQLNKQPNLNNWAGGLHPSNKTWGNFINNHCKLKFNYFGYDVYYSCAWYLVEVKTGNVWIREGYSVWRLLQELTGQPIADIRDQFDSKQEFSKATGLFY